MSFPSANFPPNEWKRLKWCANFRCYCSVWARQNEIVAQYTTMTFPHCCTRKECNTLLLPLVARTSGHILYYLTRVTIVLFKFAIACMCVCCLAKIPSVRCNFILCLSHTHTHTFCFSSFSLSFEENLLPPRPYYSRLSWHAAISISVLSLNKGIKGRNFQCTSSLVTS